MNDTLIALGVASAALAPFAWILHKRWVGIRPLTGQNVHWHLDAPDATPALTRLYTEHGEWMANEWREQHQTQGARWLLRATAAQMEQLRESGWGDQVGVQQLITKNQAMDLLMLAKAPESEDMELLQFFDVQVELPNALVVGHQASMLRLDDQAMAKWNERPASTLQKEALRYFQGKAPRSITAEEAKNSLQAIERGLHQSGRTLEWSNWLRFAETWTHLQGKDICQHYDIKKPTPAKIREAIQSLLDEQVQEWSENDVVIQRLVELYPELEMRTNVKLA